MPQSQTIAWGDLQQIYYGDAFPPNAPNGSIFIDTASSTTANAYILVLNKGWLSLSGGGSGGNLSVATANILVGTRPKLNFDMPMDGTTFVTGADNPSSNQVDIVINSKVQVATANVLVGTERQINFKIGALAVDNPSNQSVDVSIPSQGVALAEFQTDVASVDIGGYYQLTATKPVYAETSVTVADTSLGDTDVLEFATNSGSPNITFINDGTWHIHTRAYHSGGNPNSVVNLYCSVFKRNISGTETLLFTTDYIGPLTTAVADFDSYTIAAEFNLSSTDRIVIHYHAVVSGHAVSSISFNSGGTASPRIELPASPPAPSHALLDGLYDNDTEQITPSEGMLIYANSFDLWDALNPGTNGYVLTMVAGQPAWQPASGGGTGSWSRIFIGG